MRRKHTGLRLRDADGRIYHWSVRYQRATACATGRKPKTVHGWLLRDHEGVERFTEGNWLDFVCAFHLISGNYGFTPLTTAGGPQ